MARPRKLTEEFRLRRRRDGIWEVVWLNLETRKPKRKSAGERDRKLAEARFPQILADAKLMKPPANETVGWIIDTYLSDKEREKSPSQFATIRAQLRPVKEHLGALRPDQILQPIVDGYVDWRRSQVRWKDHPKMKAKAEKTISDSTIKAELTKLRAAMNHMGSEYGRKDLAPLFKIKVSDGLPREDYLTRAEVQRMLDCCGEGREHIELFLLVSVATAARKKAVLDLRWSQVHIGALTASDDVEGTWINFGPGEGKKRRPRIPIPSNMRLWTLLTMPRKHPTHVITYRGKLNWPPFRPDTWA